MDRFIDLVTKFGKSGFYTNVIQPTANASVRLVRAIAGAFRKK